MKDYYLGKNSGKFNTNFMKTPILDLDSWKNIHAKTIVPCHDIYIEFKLNNKKGLLMVKRKQAPAKGTLWPIGGKILRGVPTEESLRLKVKEECNLDIHDIKFLGASRIFLDEEPLGHKKGYDALSLVFYAKGSGNLKLNELHHNPEIITKAKYKSFKETIHPYLREFMDKAIKLTDF
ncbi:MAG: NUDIX domain-containing protein [archaeon]